MSRAAPGELELVRAFVNTIDLETGVDEIAGHGDLGAWLAARSLLAAGATVTAGDRVAAPQLREALRAVLRSHVDGIVDPAAPATLDAAARRARLVVRFAEDGTAAPQPDAGGVAGALGRLLAIVVAAQGEGTWERLKACPEPDCGWAFYDGSRNRSARWCTMDVCGNRTKVRRYRERRA